MNLLKIIICFHVFAIPKASAAPEIEVDATVLRVLTQSKSLAEKEKFSQRDTYLQVPPRSNFTILPFQFFEGNEYVILLATTDPEQPVDPTALRFYHPDGSPFSDTKHETNDGVLQLRFQPSSHGCHFLKISSGTKFHPHLVITYLYR